MLNHDNYPTDRFSPTYEQVIRSLYAEGKGVGMDGRSPLFVLEGTEKLIKEELVRCIWFGRHVKKGWLFTDDGLRIEILSPGRWNAGGGPDFRYAELLLEGKGLVKGDVEVHVFASDWTRHQHDKQDTYDMVRLHVVMWNDIEGGCCKNAMGQPIPQFTLSKFLEAGLDDIIDVIDVESYVKGVRVNPGHCRTEMENRDAGGQWVGRFLDYAGDERILQKARRYEAWVERKPFEQALYEAVMESLGYKNNKEPFLALASLVTMQTIRYAIPDDMPVREKNVYIQALLLGMAGLLPLEKGGNKDFSEEARFYVNSIRQVWDATRTKIGQSPMVKTDWSYAGIRPANFPERRIAAMSDILSACSPHGVFQRILRIFEQAGRIQEEREIIKMLIRDIQEIFLESYDPYWSHHYTIGGKRFPKPQKLLGKERTSAILINVIIPVMLVYARRHADMKLEKMLHLIYRNYKPLFPTSVTRFMEERIMGESRSPRGVVDSVRRQQGLYQIFKDFCENDNVSCNKCALYLSMVER